MGSVCRPLHLRPHCLDANIGNTTRLVTHLQSTQHLSAGLPDVHVMSSRGRVLNIMECDSADIKPEENIYVVASVCCCVLAVFNCTVFHVPFETCLA